MMYFPTRVRDARQLAGFTQGQLAEMSGISQSLISMFESGGRSIGDDQVRLISEITHLPRTFFEKLPSAIPDDAINFRKLKSSSAKDNDRARAMFKELHRAAVQLLAQAEYPFPTVPVVQDREFPLSDEHLEELAAETRSMFQLGKGVPVPNMFRALERRGIAVAPLVIPSGAEDKKTKTGHFGASHWDGLSSHAVVAYIPGSSGDRDRFTGAHELAHIVLHTYRPFVPLDAREKEADRFAAAFLLPSEQMRAAISESSQLRDFAQVKAIWGVSIQAIMMRGKSLGIISEGRFTSLYKQLSARGWRMKEPVDVPNESPVLLNKVLVREYGDRPFLNSRVEKELGLSAALVHSFASAPGLDQLPDGNLENVVHVDFGAVRSR